MDENLNQELENQESTPEENINPNLEEQPVQEEKQETEEQTILANEEAPRIQPETQPDVTQPIQQKALEKKSNKTVKSIVAIVLIIAVIFGVASAIVIGNEKRAEEERIRIAEQEKAYQEKVSETIAYILTNCYGGSRYLTIYLELYQEYYTLGESYVKSVVKANSDAVVSKMEEYDGKIVENMKWLNTNKTEKYNDVYNVLLDMYDSYRYFYDKAIDLDVSDEVIEKGQDIIDKYNRIIIIMPELENDVESKQNTIEG